MRLKDDGSLDLDWRERIPSYRSGPRMAEDYEDMREELISELLRDPRRLHARKRRSSWKASCKRRYDSRHLLARASAR
jgi:hypothetical protein